MTLTRNDFARVSWKEIDNIADKLARNIEKFIKKQGLQIAYIAPILRGGDVPAVLLSHRLKVWHFLPIQLRFQEVILNSLCAIPSSKLAKNQSILLVEGNQISGNTANMAVEMIREKFGKNTKVIYACISTDYSTRNQIKNIVFQDYGILTNEMQTLSASEYKKLGVRPKLTVFPWEDFDEEVREASMQPEVMLKSQVLSKSDKLR